MRSLTFLDGKLSNATGILLKYFLSLQKPLKYNKTSHVLEIKFQIVFIHLLNFSHGRDSYGLIAVNVPLILLVQIGIAMNSNTTLYTNCKCCMWFYNGWYIASRTTQHFVNRLVLEKNIINAVLWSIQRWILGIH